MEMKASELRIANLVLNDGCVCEVLSIFGGSYSHCVLKTRQGNEINAQCEYLSPIPLTEEWLVKFGFEKRNNAWAIKNDAKIYNSNGFQFSIWKDLTYNTGEISPPLEFVHQLQNLYFALTGTELQLQN